MQTTRQNRISRLIQTDLGDIFVKEMKAALGASLVTVTKVRVTPDLSIARIYVSIFPIGDTTKERVMQAIDDHSGDIRRRLGLREGKQLRIIPHLEFYLDDSLDYIENIERLLKS
ncbi:MAG: ribosome-binding factor A [bacterium P3]|nr:MAG: ribosome-binding factor A [bacterium P3]KWW40742.1 MAG: ribosome-binding factor A [bacterium F083]